MKKQNKKLIVAVGALIFLGTLNVEAGFVVINPNSTSSSEEKINNHLARLDEAFNQALGESKKNVSDVAFYELQDAIVQHLNKNNVPRWIDTSEPSHKDIKLYLSRNLSNYENNYLNTKLIRMQEEEINKSKGQSKGGLFSRLFSSKK